MGIPKFYRWMSERYAALSRTVKDNEVRAPPAHTHGRAPNFTEC